MRPGACPDGMAGQCPRGRLDATEDDFTVAPPGAPQPAFPPACSLTQRSPRRSTAGVEEEAGEASHGGCSEAADPEGKDHPDLLGEEAADGTAWWR
jgi:hypothetical protein